MVRLGIAVVGDGDSSCCGNGEGGDCDPREAVAPWFSTREPLTSHRHYVTLQKQIKLVVTMVTVHLLGRCCRSCRT